LGFWRINVYFLHFIREEDEIMSIQPLLPFEDVPVTCQVRANYHAIAPCLAKKIEPRKPGETAESFLFERFALAQAISGRRSSGLNDGFRSQSETLHD